MSHKSLAVRALSDIAAIDHQVGARGEQFGEFHQGGLMLLQRRRIEQGAAQLHFTGAAMADEVKRREATRATRPRLLEHEIQNLLQAVTGFIEQQNGVTLCDLVRQELSIVKARINNNQFCIHQKLQSKHTQKKSNGHK